MTTQDDSQSSRWIGRPGPTAYQGTADEAVWQELAQFSNADLEAILEPRFMFSSNCDPEFRSRITLRQRVARELLDERATAAGTYRPEPPHPASRLRRWWQAP